MNKEEILAKSRRENLDEGKTNAENQGLKIGSIAFTALIVFLILFNLCTNQPNDALLAIFWAFLAAQSYPRYRFSKEKSFLVTTIGGSLLSIANLATYIISVVG